MDAEQTLTGEQIQSVIEKWRPALDRLAGVGRKVVAVCPDCWFEIDQWDQEEGREHVCPPSLKTKS